MEKKAFKVWDFVQMLGIAFAADIYLYKATKMRNSCFVWKIQFLELYTFKNVLLNKST